MFHAVVAVLTNVQFVVQVVLQELLLALARTAGIQENLVQNALFVVEQSITQQHQNFAQNADQSIR